MLKTLMVMILSVFLAQTTFSQASNGPTNSVVTKPDESSEAKNPIADPLVRVLITKGILTEAEGHSIATSGNAIEQEDRLASLLRDKGLISAAEYEAVRTVVPAEAFAKVSSPAYDAPVASSKPQTPPAPTVIAAVAPVRLLGIDPPKREGLIPDIKLGTGARLKLYGFFKTSIIHDSSSPQGNDFPLPLLASDTGPNGSPEFHLKVRAFRLGANFEWLDAARWTGYIYYGYDQATARDARRFGPRGSRSDLFSGNLQYKWNSFVTFGYEQGLYRTWATDRFGALPLFRGIPSYTSHNIRSEFAAIFSF